MVGLRVPARSADPPSSSSSSSSSSSTTAAPSPLSVGSDDEGDLVLYDAFNRGTLMSWEEGLQFVGVSEEAVAALGHTADEWRRFMTPREVCARTLRNIQSAVDADARHVIREAPTGTGTGGDGAFPATRVYLPVTGNENAQLENCRFLFLVSHLWCQLHPLVTEESAQNWFMMAQHAARAGLVEVVTEVLGSLAVLRDQLHGGGGGGGEGARTLQRTIDWLAPRVSAPRWGGPLHAACPAPCKRCNSRHTRSSLSLSLSLQLMATATKEQSALTE